MYITSSSHVLYTLTYQNSGTKVSAEQLAHHRASRQLSPSSSRYLKALGASGALPPHSPPRLQGLSLLKSGNRRMGNAAGAWDEQEVGFAPQSCG